jgi:hypothetical protein
MTSVYDIVSVLNLVVSLLSFILICFMAYIVVAGRKKFTDTNAMISNYFNRPPKT